MRALALAFLLAAPAAAYEPCGIALDSLSASSAAPGEEFVMSGKWGPEQGKKLPVINRGSMRLLEVLDWDAAELVVRVPEDLKPGRYKVGVYCNPLSEGGSFSSAFLDFEVAAETASGSSAVEARTPSERAPDSRDGETLNPVLSGVPALGSAAVFFAVFVAGLYLTLKRRSGIVTVKRGP